MRCVPAAAAVNSDSDQPMDVIDPDTIIRYAENAVNSPTDSVPASTSEPPWKRMMIGEIGISTDIARFMNPW